LKQFEIGDRSDIKDDISTIMAFAKGKYGPSDWNPDLEKTKEKLNPFSDDPSASRNYGI
jgi:hypothetical protein